jgi:hypothetical protein
MASIDKSAKPTARSRRSVLRKMARRAASLRGRPGGRFLLPGALPIISAVRTFTDMGLRYHVIKFDTNRIESKAFRSSGRIRH